MVKQKSIIGYSITNLGIFLLYSFPATYLFHFFTDSVAEGGLGFSISQDFIRYLLITIGLLIGVVMAPLFGILSDKTKYRPHVGKRRLWMIIFAPFTGFLFVMLTIPFFREYFMTFEAATIYLITIYSIYSVVINAFNTPYMGLMADITTPESRIKMSGMYNLLGGVGTGLGLLLPGLIHGLTNSWILVTVVYAIIVMGTSIVTIITIKEDPKIVDETEAEVKIPFKEVLKDKKFLIFESAQFLWNLAFNLVLASLPAIAASVFGLAESEQFGYVMVILLLILGVFFFIYLNKGEKWGKQRTMTIALIYMGIVFPFGSLIYFTRVFGFVLIQGLIFVTLVAAGLAAIFVFPMSILMDIIKKKQEASYMGTNMIFMNTSGAIGTLIMSLVTWFFAGDAFFVIAPLLGICVLIAGLIFKFYPLYDKSEKND
ncbi:MAG: MFS transporter [Candidatus Lokiarchaeota archaeon]|nr:MFS transporter [Candidatus Lokiarchaeota archaeon]